MANGNSSRTSEVLLRYKTDTASIAKTVKAGADIRKSIQAIGHPRAIEPMRKDFQRFAQDVKKAEERTRQLEREFRQLDKSDVRIKQLRKSFSDLQQEIGRTRDVEKATQALRKYVNELEDTRNSVDRLSVAQDRFDATSRRVALAGDFQSNLGAVRGLSGLAGLGGAGEGIGAVGEIVVLAEELPRLKEAVTGLPGTIKAAADAIGGPGIGLIASAFALAAAMKFASDQAQAAKQAFNAITDAQTEYFTLTQTGTSEQLQTQREALTLQLDAAQRDLELKREQAQALDRQTGALGDVFQTLNKVGVEVGVGGASFAVAADNVTEASTKVAGLAEQIRVIDRALEDATVTANDAAEAEKNLSQQRAQNFLIIASMAAQALAAEQQALTRSAEANRDRLKAINDQRAVIEREIDVLRLHREESEAVTQRLNQLTLQLAALGQEAQTITELLPGQEFAERAKANKEQTIKELEADKVLAAERAAIAENLRNALQAIALDTARRQLETMKRLEEAAAKLESDLQASLNAATERARQTALEAQRDFQRRQIENDIKHYRALEDLRRKFERAEQDASLDRDFRRLFELRQQRQREFEDAARARQDQLSDEQRAFDQQAADRAAALQQERQDLIAAAVIRRMELQADYQKQLQTIRENQARQLVELSEKYGFELQIRQDGHSQEAALLQNAINAELQLRQQGYIAELTLLRQFIGASVSLLTPRSTGSTSSTTPITKTLGTGNTTSTPSVPSTPAKGDGGSKPPVTINVNGGNEDRVIKVINKVLSS